MNFKKLDIYTESDAVQVLIMRLSELGINGFEIHDKADFAEFLENKEHNWDYVDDSLMKLSETDTHITCYVQDNEQGEELLSAISGALAELKGKDGEGFFGSLEVAVDEVKEEDWAENWKQYYKPFTVGRRLLIKPSWETADNPDGRRVLEIDPASSFGTGQHYTTAMMLELLDSLIHGGERMLDLGTGSGILSAAALLLGAQSVTMTDIFLNSVNTAVENAAKNGFGGETVRAYCGNIADDAALREKIGGGFDIITANIVADVIISMSPFFSDFLKPEGLLLTSGIITERLEEVTAALVSQGFKVVTVNEREGWNALVLRKA